MKASELRDLSVDDLNALILQKRKDLYELRCKSVIGNLPNPNLVGAYRKDIARCWTLITEKQKSVGAAKS